jgi:hypothetical protein
MFWFTYVKRNWITACNFNFFGIYPLIEYVGLRFIILPTVMLANFGLPTCWACHVIIYMKKLQRVDSKKILHRGKPNKKTLQEDNRFFLQRRKTKYAYFAGV